jgi:hypothetical protein
MSALEVIEQIQHLSPVERARVVRFVVEQDGALPPGKCAVTMADDGLPLIRANGGVITSELVRELESLAP